MDLSMRRSAAQRITAGLLAVVLAGMLSLPVQASPGLSFWLEKTCPSTAEPTWNACDITETVEPFGLLQGGMIVYNDRFFGERPPGVFEIAKVEVLTDNGVVAATGQVRWLKDAGLFTFKGTETMPGFHANGRVEFVRMDGDRFVYELIGTYHIDPAP